MLSRNFLWLLLITVTCAKIIRKELLENKHFIIGTVESPPYVTIKRDIAGKLSGVDGYVDQIVQYLSRKYRFTYNYVEAPGGNFGAVVNKTWNGLVGMLIRGEIDFTATGFSVTYDRFKVIDFTFQFEDDPFCLLISYPVTDRNISWIFKPFQHKVWLYIIASIFGCSFTSWIISRIRYRQFSIPHNSPIFSHFIFFFAVLVNPGYRYPSFRYGARTVIAVWCLMAIVISYSYHTSVKSYLTVPKYHPIIKSIDDLAENAEYQFIVQKYVSLWSQMMLAESGTFVKIGDSLRKYPENSLESLSNVSDLVANHNKVYAMKKSTHLVRIRDDLKATGKCRLYIAEKSLDISRSCFSLPIKSPLTDILNHEIVWIRQTGLLSYWHARYWPVTNRCSAPLSTQPPSKFQNLNLNYLFSPFLVFFFGTVASFLAFNIETLFYRAANINRVISVE